MKNLNDEELSLYLNKIETNVTCIRVYQIESNGLDLFEYVKGDKDSIMGLPIKEIINYIKNLKNEKFGIIGNPIRHSLSPVLHKYWFNKYNIDAEYEIIEAKDEDLQKL